MFAVKNCLFLLFFTPCQCSLNVIGEVLGGHARQLCPKNLLLWRERGTSSEKFKNFLAKILSAL